MPRVLYEKKKQSALSSFLSGPDSAGQCIFGEAILKQDVHLPAGAQNSTDAWAFSENENYSKWGNMPMHKAPPLPKKYLKKIV